MYSPPPRPKPKSTANSSHCDSKGNDQNQHPNVAATTRTSSEPSAMCGPIAADSPPFLPKKRPSGLDLTPTNLSEFSSDLMLLSEEKHFHSPPEEPTLGHSNTSNLDTTCIGKDKDEDAMLLSPAFQSPSVSRDDIGVGGDSFASSLNSLSRFSPSQGFERPELSKSPLQLQRKKTSFSSSRSSCSSSTTSSFSSTSSSASSKRNSRRRKSSGQPPLFPTPPTSSVRRSLNGHTNSSNSRISVSFFAEQNIQSGDELHQGADGHGKQPLSTAMHTKTGNSSGSAMQEQQQKQQQQHEHQHKQHQQQQQRKQQQQQQRQKSTHKQSGRTFEEVHLNTTFQIKTNHRNSEFKSKLSNIKSKLNKPNGKRSSSTSQAPAPPPISSSAACAGASGAARQQFAPMPFATPTRDELDSIACADINVSDQVQRLKDSGIKLVAIDFDNTFLSIHTEGTWRLAAAQLRHYIRPVFKSFVPALLSAGIVVGMVTFSPQVLHAFACNVLSVL